MSTQLTRRGAGALLVAGLLLPALPARAQQIAESRLNKIQKGGTIRVGTTGDFNPMSFRDPGSNEYKGFDIDAMRQLGTDLGVKIEWVQTEWATLVAGIVANRYDIFSGASVSVARAKTAAFSIPYFEAGTVPLALKESAGKFKTWDNINQAGVKVAVSMGTVFADHAKQHFPKASIVAVQSPATGFQEVLAKRADVAITSNVEASGLVQRYPALTLLAADQPIRNRRPFGYVVAQDDPTWLNFVNTWVTVKKLEGFFDALEAKWMPKG
jgi:cyclohexadienyl dehydratase